MTDISPYLEKDKEIIITQGDKLPHWHQSGKIQFVTFRLADSLPQTKVAELSSIIESFKSHHPLPWDEATTIEYHKVISPQFERLLDNGYGSCLLRSPDVRKLVENAIMFYNNDRYEVIACVIMPNHVHILLQLNGSYTLAPIMQSIKRYSAKLINQQLNRTGSVWMKRYFDRIVRSERNLNHYVNYIVKNPKFLREGEFSLYITPIFNFGD